MNRVSTIFASDAIAIGEKASSGIGHALGSIS
jgi:hypothetical protein